MPGVVIQNNVLEEGGLGGISIQGENADLDDHPFVPALHR